MYCPFQLCYLSGFISGSNEIKQTNLYVFNKYQIPNTKQFITVMWIFLAVAVLIFVAYIILCDADLTLLFYHWVFPRKDFHGKVVWITGASSGIGECLAYCFAKHHAKLVLSGVNTERLEKVRERCIEIGKCHENDVFSLPFEIDDFPAHEECVNKVLEHFGDIDILVNNAGVSQRAAFEDIKIEVDQKLFNVNVFGTINLTRKVLKHFLEKNKGHIVVTSSLAGKIGAPHSSTYTGSKHALHGYVECLRTELIHTNINVTIVCPGPVFSRCTERCVTGKLGETYDHKEQPNDWKMKTDRCSELMFSAISYKLDECWISIHPLLITFYLGQYIPSTFRMILRLVFTKEMAMKLRQGR